MDVYGIAGAIVAAVGYVDEIVTLACRLLAALPVALGRLLDAESADAVALVGRAAGQVLAASLEKHVPQLHDAASWLDVARELVEFSFLCGTVFGPLLLDIILSVAGIGFVTAAVKLLGNTINIAADVIASMFDLIRRLLDVVDPGLCDDVIAFGTKLAGRLDVRLEDWPPGPRRSTASTRSRSRAVSRFSSAPWAASGTGPTPAACFVASTRRRSVADRLSRLDPTPLHPLGFFLEMLDGVDTVAERGIDVYSRCSAAARMSGLRDFDAWLRDASLGAGARALKKKQIADVLRILGTLDGTLTTTAQQVLVKQMWQGGKTDFFTSTLGEMYLMRHAARLDLPSSAASALGRPAPHGYLYLAQVKDRLVQDRTYDLVVIARRSSDTPALTRTDLDPDIVIRADMKWYLKMTSSLDTDALVDQFAKDLIQSIERHWAAGVRLGASTTCSTASRRPHHILWTKPGP